MFNSVKPVTLNGKAREIVDPAIARNRGYYPWTYGYCLETERWMLDRAATDMDRARQEIVLIPGADPHGKNNREWFEIWRKR